MPNANTVSFGSGQSNVDLQAQQVQLQRQQQLADMLRAQSVAPTETQMVSGRAVKNSPWLGVMQLGKALLANRMQGQNDAKQTELGKIGAERSAQALRALAPAGTFDPTPDNTGMLGLPAEDAPQGPQVSPELKAAWGRALAAYQTDPEMGRKMIQNLTDLTGNQKDWMAQGVDPKALGTAMLNKEKAGGLVNVAPNNTVLNAGTGQPMFAAPDFSNGRTNSFGPNGAPQVSLMQGSEVIPQQAGAIEAAKAAAQAGYQLKEYTPQGGTPMLSTVGQIVGAPGQSMPQPGARPAPPQGMLPNQGFPPGAQLPAPTPGMQPRADILQQERAAIMARPDSPQKAADLAAIDREIGGKQGAMPGIPLQTPAQAAQQVGQVQNNLDVEKARILAAQSPEAIQKLADAQGVIGLTGMARKILEEGKATGSLAGQLRDTVAGTVGVSTKSSQAAAQLSAIGASLTSKMPKMSGPQSDKDVLEYKTMAGRVGDASLPIGDRIAALGVVERLNQKYLDQNQNSVAAEAQSANVRNGKIKRYNPATGRLE